MHGIDQRRYLGSIAQIQADEVFCGIRERESQKRTGALLGDQSAQERDDLIGQLSRGVLPLLRHGLRALKRPWVFLSFGYIAAVLHLTAAHVYA